jgi:hypothetical protein
MSYPYAALAFENSTGAGSNELIFISKRTGAWVQAEIDSASAYIHGSDPAFWTQVAVANSGTLFCCVVYEAETGLVSYTSNDEGITWERQTVAWPSGYESVPYNDNGILLASNGIFGLWNFTGWLISSDGILWTRSECDYLPALLYRIEWTHIGTDGRIHVAIEDEETGLVYYSRGEGFSTWSTPLQLISSSLLSPGISCCGNDDIIFIAAVDEANSLINTALSLDGGTTWATGVIDVLSLTGEELSGASDTVGIVKNDTAYVLCHIYGSPFDIMFYAEEVSAGSLTWLYGTRPYVESDAYAWDGVGAISSARHGTGWIILGATDNLA